MAVTESPGQFWDNRPPEKAKARTRVDFPGDGHDKEKHPTGPIYAGQPSPSIAAAGLSSIEIAKSMGSTPASVKNVCCRHKIKIPRKRRSASNTLAKLVARLPASLSAGFQRKAEQLQ